MGLYGGLDAKGIHQRKGLKKSQKILDHMGITELAANLFRATQAEEKLRRENIIGKTKANQTHFELGKKVRRTILELGGTMPENLPAADSSVDVVMSNCVINLSPDKQRVFHEAFRVLRPGGRLAISDVIATAPLPEAIRNDLALYSCCVAGAATISEMETILEECGFLSIRIQPKDESREFIREWAPGRNIEHYIVSAIIEAVKPKSAPSHS